MKVAIPFLVFIALTCVIAWLRRGNGGDFGQMVRDSDHAAWQYAVEQKEAELRDLREAEPTPAARSEA